MPMPRKNGPDGTFPCNTGFAIAAGYRERRGRSPVLRRMLLAIHEDAHARYRVRGGFRRPEVERIHPIPVGRLERGDGKDDVELPGVEVHLPRLSVGIVASAAATVLRRARRKDSEDLRPRIVG